MPVVVLRAVDRYPVLSVSERLEDSDIGIPIPLGLFQELQLARTRLEVAEKAILDYCRRFDLPIPTAFFIYNR